MTQVRDIPIAIGAATEQLPSQRLTTNNRQPTTHNPQPTTHNPQQTTHNKQLNNKQLNNKQLHNNMMHSIKHFWNQFKKMNLELYIMEDLPRDVMDKTVSNLSQALAAYHKDLGFLIKCDTPQAELMITANGNPYLFKDVELLIHFAPTLERWKISAFIPPDTDLQLYKDAKDPPLLYHGVSIKVSDSFFKIIPHNSKSFPLSIQVLLKNYVVYKDHPKLSEAVNVQIEHLLGEKVFANQLAFIDIAQLTPKKRVKAFPLYQLYEHFLKKQEK